jgi:hypothetical protein
MRKLLDIIDYDNNIEVAKNLTGEYNNPIIFHCYWKGDLNSKHLASIKSCYYYNISNKKNRKIVLWIENNVPNTINIKLQKYCEIKNFNLDFEKQNTFLSNININNGFNDVTLYSDYIRMILLYKYGGCWFDLDIYFLRCIDPVLVNYENEICVIEWGNENFPNNCLIISLESNSEKLKHIIEYIITRNRGFGFLQANLTYDLPLDFLVLPCAWFDPLMIRQPYTNIKTESFFKTTSKEYTFDNFFNGAFTYHWHNQWNTEIESNSIFCQLNSIIDKKIISGGRKKRTKRYKRKTYKKRYSKGGNLPNLYCFWTGTNEMSSARKNNLETLKNSGFNVVLVTPSNLNEYIKESLHEGFQYLSDVHKADYLRTYFMHFYGGGYSDIKKTTESWLPTYNQLQSDPNKYIAGYKELDYGVGNIKNNKNMTNLLKKNYEVLIGNGAYICKPNTPFTNEWYSNLVKKMDSKLALLKQYPSRSSREEYSTSYPYPFRFAELLREIFHPLCYKYKEHIINTLPPPDFTNYM